MRIIFNQATLTGKEFEYIEQAIKVAHVSGDGPFSKKCHALLEAELGVPKALLTTSCTHALEMAALLLELEPGDEVIVPSFTFVSTVNAFVLRGARPVFIDVRPDTLNLDERQLEALITPAHARHRAGALRRRGLRDGRHPGDRQPSRHRRWSKTTPTACSASTRAATSAPSARWPPRASTRPRTSPAARAARC